MKNKNTKKYTIIISLIAVIALILAIVISSFISNYHEPFPDINDGSGPEVDEKSLVFYNQDIVELAYTMKISSIILDNIETVIFSPEEMKYSTDNKPLELDKNLFYDATIDMGDFVSYNSLITKFSLSTSDNRRYITLVKSATLSSDTPYIYTAVMRDAPDTTITVFINGDKTDADQFKNLAQEKLGRHVSEVKYYTITDSGIEADS